MKTELLVQMDGLAKSDDLVFLLAASNIPWYVVCVSVLLMGITEKPDPGPVGPDPNGPDP